LKGALATLTVVNERVGGNDIASLGGFMVKTMPALCVVVKGLSEMTSSVREGFIVKAMPALCMVDERFVRNDIAG